MNAQLVHDLVAMFLHRRGSLYFGWNRRTAFSFADSRRHSKFERQRRVFAAIIVERRINTLEFIGDVPQLRTGL